MILLYRQAPIFSANHTSTIPYERIAIAWSSTKNSDRSPKCYYHSIT